jgi:arylsulfatase A-like enzyme
MRRQLAILALGSALASPSFALPRAEADGAPARPNVVFVLADDLGYAELGSYGQQEIRTPSLDRLAAEGVRFTQHYSGNAVCAPSRSVLLTGRHPGRTPIRDNREVQPEGQVPLPGAAVTLAELLKKEGYVTGAMGKWGLGPPGSEGDPLRQGFDRFFGYNCQRQAHNFYPAYLYDDGRRLPLDNPPFPAHQKLPDGSDPNDPRSFAGYEGTTYAPDVIWERARAFIRDNRERPFFLYLPTTVPHLALQVPEDSLAEYRGLWPDPPYRGDNGYLPHPSPRAAYAAMVTRMDREVGRILDLVRELGLDERTIVVFTSDNGPTYDRLGGSDSEFFRSAGPLRGLKGSLHEGGVRVPAIVRWTGRIPAGMVSERVTGFEDWLPTLLELAGAKEVGPGDTDGLSFAPTLLGREQEPRPFLYREFAGYGGQQSVRVGDWKGVRQGLGRPGPVRLELYDLEGDVGEARDVSAEHPDVVAKMEAILAREHQPSSAFPLPAIDGETPRYVVARSPATARALLSGGDAAWAAAQRVTWGPEAIATTFRALWTADGLALRYDVTDPSPWHTLTRRDERLWNEEVVELFLDVGATGWSYAEIEWNPVNAVVDLWVDRPENRYDKEWDAAGLESRVHPTKDSAGRTSGWTVTSILPWRALAAKAPPGTALPPEPGDRWRFNAFRIERPGGPKEPEKDAQLLAWSPTGHRSFHVPLAFREMVFAETARPVPPGAPAAPPRRLNIVSIVTDDQASWSMGAYGNPDARTPVLDRLAREGVLFRNALVTTPVCSPSRAGFLTGRYGTELGIRDWISPDEAAGGLGLPPGIPTWPAILRENGWRTALVGKWHLGRRPHPSAFGIDRFFGFLDGGNAPMDPTLEVEGREQVVKGPIPDLITDEAIRFVHGSGDQPFALLVHFREPHTPYGPVPEADTAALRGIDPVVPDVRGIDREQVKAWTREYLASVHSIDRNVGRLLEALDRLGLAGRTVVLFTSDNGYNIGHHALHTKGNGHWVAGGVTGPPRPNMFDTSLRVPLVFRGPGLPSGREVGGPVTQLDTLPTVLALLGVPMPDGLVQHGRDLSPLLRGEAVPWPDTMFGEFDMHHYTLARMRMVRTARHKLVRYLGTRFQDELYDLSADPGETRNLYQSETVRAVREGLEARLAEWRRGLGIE